MNTKNSRTTGGNWQEVGIDINGIVWENKDIADADIELIKNCLVCTGYCPLIDGSNPEQPEFPLAYAVIKVSDLSDSLRSYLEDVYNPVRDVFILQCDAQFGWTAVVGSSEYLNKYMENPAGISPCKTGALVSYIVANDVRFNKELTNYVNCVNDVLYKNKLYESYKFICVDHDRDLMDKNTLFRISTPYLYRMGDKYLPVIADVRFLNDYYMKNECHEQYKNCGYHMNKTARTEVLHVENPDGSLTKIDKPNINGFVLKDDPFNDVSGNDEKAKNKIIHDILAKGGASYYLQGWGFRVAENAENLVTFSAEDFGAGCLPLKHFLDPRCESKGDITRFDHEDNDMPSL